MKSKKLFLIFIGILVINSIYSQIHNATVEDINEYVATIVERSDLTLIEIDEDHFLDSAFLYQPGEGFGNLSGFYDKDELIMIMELYGIITPIDFAIVMYFFDHGKLIYVSETEQYSFSDNFDSDGNIKENIYDYEAYYYFTIDSLIKKEIGEQKLIPNEKYFDSQTKEGQLLNNAKRYSDLLRKAYHDQ